MERIIVRSFANGARFHIFGAVITTNEMFAIHNRISLRFPTRDAYTGDLTIKFIFFLIRRKRRKIIKMGVSGGTFIRLIGRKRGDLLVAKKGGERFDERQRNHLMILQNRSVHVQKRCEGGIKGAGRSSLDPILGIQNKGVFDGFLLINISDGEGIKLAFGESEEIIACFLLLQEAICSL